MIDISKIKKMRELTSCPVMECKKALEEAGGDIQKAILNMRGLRPLNKDGLLQKNGRIDVRETDEDLFVGVLRCNTDFAANSEEVKKGLKEALEHPLDGEVIDDVIDRLCNTTKEDLTIMVYQYSKFKRTLGYYLHFDHRKVGIVYAYQEVNKDFCDNMSMQVVAYPYLESDAFFEPLLPQGE